MNTKVDNKTETAKKFIPGQVHTHNKAVDILSAMQRVINKINELKKQIENVYADIEIMHEAFQLSQLDIRVKLVYLHDWQVMVYRRLLAYYFKTILNLYQPSLYHHIYTYSIQQPDVQKNVKVA